MVGDSKTDMQFGRNLGIRNAFIINNEPLKPEVTELCNEVYVDLLDFAKKI